MAKVPDFVALGDFINLFCVDTNGYVFSYKSSQVENGVFVYNDQNRDKPEGITDSRMCTFRVCLQNRYKLTKKYQKLLREAETDDEAYHGHQLTAAKSAAEAEMKDNVAEQNQLTNKRIMYGEIIQLQHIYSGKYVHINTTTGSVRDQDNMLVYLESGNNKSAHFRISPRFKVNSDGDVIQLNDHVVFESIKMPGHYLHASKPWQIDKFTRGSELNIGMNRSGFIMSVSFRPTADEKEAMQFGDTIQLYHRELESHLVVDGGYDESPAGEALYFHEKDYSTNPMNVISDSGACYWQVESADHILSAFPVRWGQSVRIRHSITHHYVCLDEELNLTMSRDSHDVRAVFSLHAVKKGGEFINRNAMSRIRHVLTGYWLHAVEGRRMIEDDLAIRADFSYETIASTTLAATELEQYRDAFILLATKESGLVQFNYTAGLVPFFSTFIEQLTAKGLLRQMEKCKIVLMLNELYHHIQAAGNRSHQMKLLLRDFKVIDLLLDLMKFKPPSAAAARQMILDVILASYRVVEAYLEGPNRENAAYLVKELSFFCRQLETKNAMIAHHSALTLKEILRDNSKVLATLEDTDILYVVSLVKRSRNHMHLEILTAMCVCEERGLSKNQHFMAENLMKPEDCALYRFSFGSDCDQAIASAVYISRFDGKWEEFVKFVQAGVQGERQDEYLFMLKQLKLLERLCHGSNTAVIRMILKERNVISWKVMFVCLENESLPADIRAAFARLIEYLCVLDGTSFLATDTLSLSFLFDAIGRQDPTKRKEARPDEEHGEAIKMQVFLPLRDWLISFLRKNAVVVCSSDIHNQLIAQVLHLANAMLHYGYFGGRPDLRKLTKSVVDVLDGRTDIPKEMLRVKKVRTLAVAGYDKRDLALLERYRNAERFRASPQTTRLVDVKLEALKVIKTAFMYQYHTILDVFLTKFKIVHSHGWLPNEEMADTLTKLVSHDRKDKRLTGLISGKLDDVFNSSSFFDLTRLSDILFDLINYEYDALKVQSTTVLNLLYSSKEKLFQRAAKSQVLITENSCCIYEMAQDKVPLLRLLCGSVLDDKQARRAGRDFAAMTKACILKEDWDIPHPINQNIFINHGMLSVLYDMLSHYATMEMRRLSRPVIKAIRRALHLLAALCNRNPYAQGRTFEKLDLLIRMKSFAQDVGVCIQQIFSCNESLCLNVSTEMINRIVRTAGLKREKGVSIIRALEHLVQIPAGKLIIPRNQDIVIKAIMHDFHNVAYVLDKPRAIKEKILMGECGDEHRYYMLTLVNLLATSAEGENILIESLCQKFIVLDEILFILNHEHIDWYFKAPFLRYLDTVYMNTISNPAETGALELAHSSETWLFMEKILELLDEMMSIFHSRKEILDPLLSMMSSFSTKVDRNDRTEYFQCLLRTYFFAIVPFLTRFMSKFFDRDDVNFPEEIAIVNNLAEKSLEFATLARPCIFNEGYMLTLVTAVTVLAKHASVNTENLLDCLTKIRAMVSLKPGLVKCVEEQEFAQYSEIEADVNRSLGVFTENFRLVYGNRNTVAAQMGSFTKYIPKKIASKEYMTRGPTELPLGPEFQTFVSAHVDHAKGVKSMKDKYARALNIMEILEFCAKPNINDKERIQLDEVIIKCLQGLRALMHNEICLLPTKWEEAESGQLKAIRNIQNVFVNAGVFEKVQRLMVSPNKKLAMEVLTFFSTLFFNANKDAQSSMMDFFSSSREENFFAVATRIMNDTGYQIKEIRSLYMQKKKLQSRTKNLTLQEFLLENIRYFTPERMHKLVDVLPKKKHWLFALKKKRTIVEELADIGETTDIELEEKQDHKKQLKEKIATDDADQPDCSLVIGSISQVLALVGQMVDGQHRILQDYLREQPDNPKSFNLVRGTGRLLNLIYTTISSSTIDLITIVMDTLNELSTGNIANQAVVHEGKIVDQINYMLRSGEIAKCHPKHALKFMSVVIKLLRTITEENYPNSVERTRSITYSLDWVLIVKTFTECFKIAKPENSNLRALNGRSATDVSEPADLNSLLPTISKKDLTPSLKNDFKEVGFAAFYLLDRLIDNEANINPNSEVNNDQSGKSSNNENFNPTYSPEQRVAYKFYKKHTMSIEILKDGYVNKISFQVPETSILRPDAIEQIRWDLDRSTYNSKIRDLMSWRTAILKDMKYQRRIMQNRLAMFFMALWNFTNNLNLLLTFALCVYVLYYYTAPLIVDDIPNITNLTKLPDALYQVGHSSPQPTDDGWLPKVTFAVAVLHAVTSVSILLTYFLRNQPSLPDVSEYISMIKEKFHRQKPDELVDETIETVTKERSLGTSVIGFTTLYYMIFVGMSFAGLFFNTMFYGFHLFNIVASNQILKRVIKAVTQNGLSLFWVLILGLMILYVYTIIMFAFFRGAFIESQNWYCGTMAKCFVSVLRYGLIGDMLDSMPIPDQEIVFERFGLYVILKLSFFIIITTIGLNIIFGIIVDTFSELRDLKWLAEKDMREICTICDMEAYKFDNNGKGFINHITKEHNVWSYMFFFLYLSETNPVDFTSLELYVNNQVENKQTDFFPLNKSLTLLHTENKEEDKLSEILEQINQLMALHKAKESTEQRKEILEKRRLWENENKSIYGQKSKCPSPADSSIL